MSQSLPSAAEESRTTLLELALLFLRLGTTAFGGPAAHIAMMQDEVVRRRGWLTDERFLDLLGATNLIPGPNSTEMAIHIGWDRRRWSGLVVAGLAFIVPAMLITWVFAWAYVQYGSLPSASWMLYGIKPVIVAVVLQAIWALTPKAAKTTFLRVLGIGVVIAVAFGVNEIIVLFAAGLIAVVAARKWSAGTSGLALILPAAASGGLAIPSIGLGPIFAVFLKIGSVLFGSGYVLLAFLRTDLVERLGWLTEAQLIDAVAAGQVTPGPVFTTATFIGYLLAGTPGALVATAGIFLPAFVFVALSGPLVPRLRNSPSAAAFLDGVNIASLALMAVVTVQLSMSTILDLPTTLIFVVSAVLLVWLNVNSTWLVAGGALAGWLVHELAAR
ncbi:MAG TPA: chromate efflux transporter [Polyangiales bacterium]|nr:chromate efflux transporter [Polyangiales bacterium]